MANLTPAEYVLNDFGAEAQLIRAVRVDSPNSVWKTTAQPIIWIVRLGKKKAVLYSLITNNYEADGTTYKKNGLGKYFEVNFAIFIEKSRKEMDEFVADTAKQTLYITNAVSEKNGIIDGPWSITQDPWDPNVVLKPMRVAPPPKEEDPVTKPDEKTGNSTEAKKEETIPTPEKKTIRINPADVVGDLVLTKVSGPGELIGVLGCGRVHRKRHEHKPGRGERDLLGHGPTRAGGRATGRVKGTGSGEGR